MSFLSDAVLKLSSDLSVGFPSVGRAIRVAWGVVTVLQEEEKHQSL